MQPLIIALIACIAALAVAEVPVGGYSGGVSLGATGSTSGYVGGVGTSFVGVVGSSGISSGSGYSGNAGNSFVGGLSSSGLSVSNGGVSTVGGYSGVSTTGSGSGITIGQSNSGISSGVFQGQGYQTATVGQTVTTGGSNLQQYAPTVQTQFNYPSVQQPSTSYGVNVGSISQLYSPASVVQTQAQIVNSPTFTQQQQYIPSVQQQYGPVSQIQYQPSSVVQQSSSIQSIGSNSFSTTGSGYGSPSAVYNRPSFSSGTSYVNGRLQASSFRRPVANIVQTSLPTSSVVSTGYQTGQVSGGYS